MPISRKGPKQPADYVSGIGIFDWFGARGTTENEAIRKVALGIEASAASHPSRAAQPAKRTQARLRAARVEVLPVVAT